MFLLAFYAFLRIGELTVRSCQDSGQCLQINNLQRVKNGFIVHFNDYAHSVPETLTQILNTAQTDRVIFPVWHLNEYLKIRIAPDANTVLFIHHSGSPVLRSEFISALKGA